MAPALLMQSLASTQRAFIPTAFRPPAENAPTKRVAVQVERIRQLLERVAIAAITDVKIALAGPVIALLLHRRPPAIIGRVIAITIDTIKGRAVWPLAHVREKISEVHPPRANRDSTSSVAFEVLMVRIEASLLHSMPCLERRAWRAHAGAATVAVSRMCWPTLHGAVLPASVAAGRRVSLDRLPTRRARRPLFRLLVHWLAPPILGPITPYPISQSFAGDSKLFRQSGKAHALASKCDHFYHAKSIPSRASHINGWPAYHGD